MTISHCPLDNVQAEFKCIWVLLDVPLLSYHDLVTGGNGTYPFSDRIFTVEESNVTKLNAI